MKKANRGNNPFFYYKRKQKAPFEAFYRINLGYDLEEELVYNSLRAVLKIKKESIRTALLSELLNGVMIKGPSLDEVVGLLRASLSLDNVTEIKKPKIRLPKGERLISYAGSGKKGFKTMNISTPAAIVAASLGNYVAKACSHSTSSMAGSSDFLSSLGIKIKNSVDENKKVLKKTGLAFFSMEKSTPLFAKVYGGRFFVPHALSFALAGLSFPIKTDIMFYGLSHPNVGLSTQVFNRFGFKNVFVITTTEDGVHYIDEFGISGISTIAGIKNGILGEVASSSFSNELELSSHRMRDIAQEKNVKKNIKVVIDVLRGKGEEARTNVICANAAIIHYLSGKASFAKSFKLAKSNIKKGKAFKKLLEIIKITGGNKSKLERFL